MNSTCTKYPQPASEHTSSMGTMSPRLQVHSDSLRQSRGMLGRSYVLCVCLPVTLKK